MIEEQEDNESMFTAWVHQVGAAKNGSFMGVGVIKGNKCEMELFPMDEGSARNEIESDSTHHDFYSAQAHYEANPNMVNEKELMLAARRLRRMLCNLN